MKVEELKIGAFYVDNDGVDMLYYVGGTGYLYNFVNAEYDDDNQEFIQTKDDRIRILHIAKAGNLRRFELPQSEGILKMTQYESYQIDNDMWYKKRKHIYHLLGVYNDGHCACIIATYSLKTKRLLIKCANEHIPESKILKQFIEYAESKESQEKMK